MAYDPQIHHRRSIRLKGYDYTQAGLFFVTICVQNRRCVFGEIPIVVSGMRGERASTRDAPTLVLNDAGKMVEREWLLLPERFPNIKLHEFVVMPNHFHGIIEHVRAPLVGAQTGASLNHQTNKPKHIGEIIGAFKSITTNCYIDGVKTKGWPVFDAKLWQRNFWEHIIKTETAYLNISNYIINNPRNWQADSLRKAEATL